MSLFSKAGRVLTISFVFVIGIAIGTICVNTTLANNNSTKENITQFPKNESGQTYGSGLDATSPNSEPDLIKAYGIDGTIGYVKSIDLKGEMPKTPEEAVSIQLNKAKESVHQIPLYDVSGKIVIGVFNVDPGTEVPLR
ncbi:peptidase M56 BlaR1 [Paenibacillus sp. LMG 31460]|uniref:Peptidase M56 BlaR1 n=1 Tax=Paenibacillus germinis TaxID=2654979 RepID=A0ABX1Z9R4_9BACL|nr:peptidase M56 BlaR1 [Paenibacillus germinis]NOU88666.1 peptidase M56 BlaR1 [Paenibacillus germinis]